MTTELSEEWRYTDPSERQKAVQTAALQSHPSKKRNGDADPVDESIRKCGFAVDASEVGECVAHVLKNDFKRKNAP